MFQNVQLLEQFNNLKIELHLMQCQLKNGKQGGERSRLRAEIAFYQEESRRLNEQMQQIETENTEINEHVRQMSEQAEMTLRQRQAQHQAAQQAMQQR